MDHTKRRDTLAVNFEPAGPGTNQPSRRNSITVSIDGDKTHPRKLSLVKGELVEVDEHDKPSKKNEFQSKKNVAEGMMDIALLTANANQLKFIITYNTNSKTYYISFLLIASSLVLQVAVGIALIFKRQMKNKGRKDHIDLMNDFLVVGVFLVTVINVFVAAFTTAEEQSDD